jgi:hypothetical protein
MTGVLSNLGAVLSHARAFLPGFKADLATIFNSASSPLTRVQAAVFLVLKVAVVAVLAYAVRQEWEQHIISQTEIAAITARKLRAEECSARSKAIIDSVPMNQIGEAVAELAKDCAPQPTPEEKAKEEKREQLIAALNKVKSELVEKEKIEAAAKAGVAQQREAKVEANPATPQDREPSDRQLAALARSRIQEVSIGDFPRKLRDDVTRSMRLSQPQQEPDEEELNKIISLVKLCSAISEEEWDAERQRRAAAGVNSAKYMKYLPCETGAAVGTRLAPENKSRRQLMIMLTRKSVSESTPYDVLVQYDQRNIYDNNVMYRSACSPLAECQKKYYAKLGVAHYHITN